jgi:hypothetical protein
MKSHVASLALLSALGAASSAAAATPSMQGGLVEADAAAWGHVSGLNLGLSGRDLNGVSLNDEVLDEHVVTGVSFTGAVLDGKPMQSVWLDDSSLKGRDHKGHAVSAEHFVGAELEATLDNGASLTLQVLDRQRHPGKGNKDVYGYEVWYETSTAPEPLCGFDEDGQAILAIPLAGRWSYGQGTPEGGSWIDDPTSFTFACEGYVLAKCVTAGYKPWERATVCHQGSGCRHTTLAAHHQACTRALRADYFGDGTAHTVDGTLINIYDGFGIRVDADPWPVDAEWNERGAVCVGQPRIASYAAEVAPLYAEDCGDVSFFADETLLVTEAPSV